MKERRNQNQIGSGRTIGELLSGKLVIAPFDLFTDGGKRVRNQIRYICLLTKTADCSRMNEDNVLDVLFMIQFSDNQFILYAL